MLMQAIFIPAVGILGNDFDRILLICIGSVIWGGMSVGFGFARDLKQVGQACALVSKHCDSCMHLRYQRWSSSYICNAQMQIAAKEICSLYILSRNKNGHKRLPCLQSVTLYSCLLHPSLSISSHSLVNGCNSEQVWSPCAGHSMGSTFRHRPGAGDPMRASNHS